VLIAFAISMIFVAAALVAVTRAVVHDQQARRGQPRDRGDERRHRYRQRAENADMVRTMLFGRWANGPRPDRTRDDPRDPPNSP
jgi:hypothetical protein